MNVYIDPAVDSFIKEFYNDAMRRHITLDEPTVIAKVKRLYRAIRHDLSFFPFAYRLARYKQNWIQLGYRDYPVENFHFAFRVYEDEIGDMFVVVHDACYDKDYHD